MAPKQQPTEPKRATLQVPHSEADNRIRAQIDRGRELLVRAIASGSELKDVRLEMYAWSDYNTELLKRIVDTDELADEYEYKTFIATLGPTSFQEELQDLRSRTQYYINRLVSILGRLELMPESHLLSPSGKERCSSSPPEVGRRVFVVHGRDEGAKQSVARCLEKLELEAIILHEQPNQGRTLMEKFEDYADVGFTVVLLTPDDIGAACDNTKDLRPRARQNVVFELGFFIGKLGRQGVCALHKGDVELPSDFAGVLWVPMDSGGAWQLALGREIRAAGLDVDLNKLA